MAAKSRREAAQLREKVTIVLPSDGGYRPLVAPCAVRAVAGCASLCVGTLADRSRPSRCMLRLWIASCSRKVGGQIPHGLRSIQIRGLQNFMHYRTVRFGTLALAGRKARQLVNEIALPLPGKGGDCSRTVAPCVRTVALICRARDRA